jgi:hypothetical protein
VSDQKPVTQPNGGLRADDAPDGRPGPAVKRRLDTNLVIAVSAVVISLCALVVSYVEVSVMRADQRASVWPYLDIGVSYDSEGFTIGATNRGLGPALVESVLVEVDGRPVRNWDEAVDRLVGLESGLDYSNTLRNTINGEVLPAERELLLFRVTGGWTPVKRELADQLNRLDWRMCYCSVYGDCWTVSRDGSRSGDIQCDPQAGREFGL